MVAALHKSKPASLPRPRIGAKAGELSEAIKKLIVKGSLLVMTADGPHPDIDEKVLAMGTALGFSEARVGAIIAGMFGSAEEAAA